jgi:hypothetical protein
MPKKIFTQELEGTRQRGRPRKGWKEEVERDLKVLGVRWRELVTDRKKWRDIVQQAKAHSANGRGGEEEGGGGGGEEEEESYPYDLIQTGTNTNVDTINK